MAAAPIPPAPEPTEQAARKRRNLVIGWVLAAFVVLVFAITLVRLDANVSP